MEKYKQEFECELRMLCEQGIKHSPLRESYESAVRNLKKQGEELLQQGVPEEQVAHLLYKKRRELGKQYKEAAPPLFREYIYFATAQKYGDPLGPSYEILRTSKNCIDIIASASRPIANLNDRLTIDGFVAWYKQYCIE